MGVLKNRARRQAADDEPLSHADKARGVSCNSTDYSGLSERPRR